MSNGIFIDGIIYGEKTYGGIARMWDEIIPRLHYKHLPLILLLPFKSNNSLQSQLGSKENIQLPRDFFYWPRRIFNHVEVRSNILKGLYGASKARIFHSTYFTTVDSPRTVKFITIYDMIYEIFMATQPTKWDRQVLHNKQICIENADQIICISNNTKRDLLKFYPKISESQISVIHPGTPTLEKENTHISLFDISTRYGIKISAHDYYLVVGRLDRYKNFKILVDLLEQNQKARQYKFLCVGSGGSTEIREIASATYPNNFIFIDFVQNEELAVLYRNAIGLVYPSLYEGFGLPVLEAMSHSCPVACAYSSSLPEVGGEAAFYFDPLSTSELYQRLIDLMDCDREQVVIKGLRQVQKFSWDESVSALISLYKAFL